uniref:GAG-pre-integrase domain-containing protein n=2 Tax=Physcomitrium patens TaxID=3218 RepID=A0A7I3Z931_PHYPA
MPLSNTTVKYMAIATSTSEAIWLRHLLYNLHQETNKNQATLILCDNLSTVALVDTTKFYSLQ